MLKPRWLLYGPESTRDCEVIPQPRDAVNHMVRYVSTASFCLERGIIGQVCISFLRVEKLVRLPPPLPTLSIFLLTIRVFVFVP